MPNPYRRPYTVGEARSNERDNNFKFDITKSDAIAQNLAGGLDSVEIKSDGVEEIRLTFTSAEVGNGMAFDGNALANQDGGLAVRVQAEDGAGMLTGPVSRFDDEGIIFTTKGDAKFDVRDLVSGVERGNMFDVAVLGTSDGDRFSFATSSEAYYINAGMGDDLVAGGRGDDFLVGGTGSDMLYGNDGNDSFIGGGGSDFISGGAGVDRVTFNVATDGSDTVNLGTGADRVTLAASAVTQVRLTFTSAEVGNGSAADSNSMMNQDGGMAVRLQAEDAMGALTGPVSRFDDEGITFIAAAGTTFDVRDLVSGTARGDQFGVVQLGTAAGDVISNAGLSARYYVNGGMGDDQITGGTAMDFLVGGAGNDTLDGREGSDTFIGGGGADIFRFSGTPGNDTINDFVSGTDKIDLSAYAIEADNVSTTSSGANTIISVDSNSDNSTDFTITLLNAPAPMMADYIYG